MQTFGRCRNVIPDGLSGTHHAYNHNWRFVLRHAPSGEDGFTRIIWKVTNLDTMNTVEVIETINEAIRREEQGWTISNKVFRKALKIRSKQLEEIIEQETNQTRIANYLSIIKGLSPKQFNEGTLVFGLQHRIVQKRMIELLEEVN